MTLLAASPVATPCESEDGTDAETTSFSVSVHISVFRRLVSFLRPECARVGLMSNGR